MPKFSCVLLTVATVMNVQGLIAADEECTSGSATLNVSAEARYLTSANHPGYYPHMMNCTRRFIAPFNTRIYVWILAMDLDAGIDCRRDYVEFLQDGTSLAKLCHSDTTPVISRGNEMTLRFETDGSLSGQGFRLGYRIARVQRAIPMWVAGKNRLTASPYAIITRQLEGHDRTSFETDCPSSGSPTLPAKDEASTLISPGYPNLYRNNLNCYWKLEAQDSNKVIQIEVDNSILELNCKYDSVTAYEGSRISDDQKIEDWCGNDKPTFYSSTSTMLLHFHTDGSSTYKGFSLRYRQIDRASARSSPGYCHKTPRSTQVVNEYRELLSPNYPLHYSSNQECFWLLKASDGYVVEVVVRDSILESSCSYDHVTVRDGADTYSPILGTFCGTDTPTYYSTGVSLIVQFKSDGTNQFKGFRMEYRQIRPENVPRGPGLEVILPSVFGALAGAVLCCCCCKYCCGNDKEEASSSANQTPQATPHATITHPLTTMTWTPGGAMTVAGSGTSSPYYGQDNMNSGAPPYLAQNTYFPSPQNAPLDGYTTSNGSNLPPSGYASLPGARPPSPYISGHQMEAEGARASPLMPSAPPPPSSAPALRVIDEPPPSYDSLQFDDVTGVPLIPKHGAAEAEGEEESAPLYKTGEHEKPRKC